MICAELQIWRSREEVFAELKCGVGKDVKWWTERRNCRSKTVTADMEIGDHDSRAQGEELIADGSKQWTLSEPSFGLSVFRVRTKKHTLKYEWLNVIRSIYHRAGPNGQGINPCPMPGPARILALPKIAYFFPGHFLPGWAGHFLAGPGWAHRAMGILHSPNDYTY